MPDGQVQMSPPAESGGAHVRPVTGENLRVSRQGRVLLDIAEVGFSGDALTAIVGPNGAGKSMLMKVLAGVMKPDNGKVLWAGRQPWRAGYAKLALVLQAPVLLRRTAAANIAFALKASGCIRHEIAGRTSKALEEADLSRLSETPAPLLSGGEKQRLALARALAIEPEILLLDEPVANLDPASVLSIETMIRTIRGRGTTVVLVTHDLAQARRLADRMMLMVRGRIVEKADANTFFANPQTDEGRAFLAGEIVL